MHSEKHASYQLRPRKTQSRGGAAPKAPTANAKERGKCMEQVHGAGMEQVRAWSMGLCRMAFTGLQ